jgi:outer membrane receptor for ferrienterochelin and colicin
MACAMATAAYAQETTSAIHGMVTTDGSPVANAAVTVVHKPSGAKVSIDTGSGGEFNARGLRVGGPYTITVTGEGMEPKTVTDVFLEVGRTADVDIDLKGKDELEGVIVTAAAGTKNSDQGPKTVLGRADIQEVVTITRDPRDLARRDMLVAQDLNAGARIGVNSGGISIAGSNPRYNRIAVDGVSAQDNFGLNQGGMTTARGPVTLDAIEQFTVAAVPTDVENGDFVGGALNLVLRSGTNKFHGVGFINYLNDGMVGTRSVGNKIKQAIHQDNYGGFLSGPIWKDHLFFAVSYEKYKTVEQNPYGLAGSGAANIFSNGLTQGTIDQVVNGLKNIYGSKFDPGGIGGTSPVLDKKYSAKIDWNIMEGQRASFTYRYAKSANTLRPNASLVQAQLDSQNYVRSDLDKAATFELNSTWTDRLSTFFKVTKREYVDTQLPPSGQNFSDVRICTAPTSDSALQTCPGNFDQIFFGPDQFRHANTLSEKELRFQFSGEYALGDHRFKFGGQARQAKPLDLFVPNSRGQYYFDSLADFLAGRASRLQYSNSVTGNPEDAQFKTTYWTYSLFAQDTLQITDNLKAAVGFRYDWYSEPDKPVFNPNFFNRYAFDNQTTIDGLHILMPRVSVEWRPSDKLKFNGGFGLFAGGTPDVLTGSPFYNTGYTTTGVDILRNADGTFSDALSTPGFTQAIGGVALNNLNLDPQFGFQVPAQIRALQQGTLTGTPAISPTGSTIVLAPDFQLPAMWKVFWSGEWEAWDGWKLNGDVVVSKVRNDFTFWDLRAQPLVVNGVRQFLPDGRPRYDGLAANTPGKTSTNIGGNDIVEDVTHKGYSYTAAVQLSKTWDWGGDFAIGYARQHLRDMTAGLFFGTTAGSLYNTVATDFDPNRDNLGRSVYEIPNRFKVEFGFHKEFFGDNETRISLFAERQDGRPFGFIMSDQASGRGPVFGVTRTAQALYVPDFAADANPNDLQVGYVTFATAADLANFRRYASNFGLSPGLTKKYSNKNAAVNRIDLSLSQELPTLIQGHKLRVQFDVRNVLNLLNNKWGQVAEYTSGDGTSAIKLANVQCTDASGAVVASNNATCVGYRYSSVPTSVGKTRNAALSLWYMQVSLRYEF